MEKIILHRGNTGRGVENSLESLDTCGVIKELSKINPHIIDPQVTQIILEVDVIAKKPFIIFHNTHDKIGEHFDIDDKVLAEKYMHQLTICDLSMLPNINKHNRQHTIITLDKLLDHAHQNGLKLYLDIKGSDIITSQQDIIELFRTIKKYSSYNVIDSILSFDPTLEKEIFNFFIESPQVNEALNHRIIPGCFVNHCPEVPDSYRHTKMKLYKYSPNLISIDHNLLDQPRYYVMVAGYKTKYMWTLHKSDLSSPRIHRLAADHGLIPVIDMFDVSGNSIA